MMSADRADFERSRAQRWSVFIPLLILSVTYLAWSIFQTTQLVRERDGLAAAQVSQEKPLEESKKLREKLDTLAKETQRLANRGNRGALAVVDELRKRGITINPETKVAPPPPAASSAPRVPAIAPTPQSAPTPGK
ncbi:MAG: hypothetical protein JWN13_5280 [Betaproteobacteria bacterium]|jgi:hypothetical protein|nr:hypothetical protein [Betaproteobacteria bacterium]